MLMQSTRLVILQGQIYKTFIQVHYVLNSSELILEHHPLHKRLNTGMAPTCDWMIKIVKVNKL